VPDELVAEQIMQAIEAQLKTIVAGATYHNTINDENISSYLRDSEEFDSAENPLLQVLQGDFDGSHLVQQHRDKVELPVSIVGLLKGEPEELRTLNNRLARDCIVSLLSNVTLGGLCYTVHIESLATDNGSLAFQGHALFELGVRVTYAYSWTAP
jgi:hypothetical protein